MRLRLRNWRQAAAALALALGSAHVNAAGPAPFDLTGPTLDVRVTRGATTLPIAEVPHLASGDKLAIKSNFPDTQSEHYLMVLAFLRGSTNPPPKEWFFQCATWKKDCAAKGLDVKIPEGAQQVLVFLAPETGGDFKTMVNAVRGRPGAFVRATQDLNQATLDRSRLERYLTAIRGFSASDPVALKTSTPLLARSLGIKVDEKCLDRIPQLQAPCLMQGQESLILNDGHSMSIVEALTSGPASSLAMAASYTPEGGYGYYSPYISTVLDLGRLFESFRTANFQYIPALATAVNSRLSLTLNTPPSFHEPKSVMVAALPAIEAAQPPPLHAVNPKDIYCARRDSLVLPVEGAPLVFSTEYAHDTVLRITGQNGEMLDLPATADAVRGGFIIDTSPLGAASLADRIQGSLHGYWGFEMFDGPRFQLVNTRAQPWSRSPADDGALIVGRANTLHLQAGSVACIDRIMVKDPAGKELQVEWSPVKSNEVEINLPLQQWEPGEMTLFVTQFGAKDPQPVELRAFPEAGRLESFTVHAAEAQGTLKGSRLEDVASLSIKGFEFVPVPAASSTETGSLMMALKPVAAAATASGGASTPTTDLKQGETSKAKVTLRDGRVTTVNVSVTAPRPSVDLLGKNVQPAKGDDSNIQLTGQNQLPQDAQLTFSVRAKLPATFGRDASLEVATDDEAFATTLSLANRGLMLADAKVAVATIDPAKAFGASAFGKLKFRVIAGGVAGDWQPLVTLVRLPDLQALQCPSETDKACKLTGANLFLIDSFSGDPEFKQPTPVPEGFPGRALPVPHPGKTGLFLKLRDDPSVINAARLTAEELPAPPPTPTETANPPIPPAASTTPPSAPSAETAPAPAVTPAAGDATGAEPSHEKAVRNAGE